MKERPNLLVIVADSLRQDTAYSPSVSTPRLDRLRETGVTFTQCVSTTTSTTPSFASILTGCYPPRHGVRGLQGYRLNAQVRTLAETLAQAGYETHAEVTGPLVAETGITRGFAEVNHRPGYKVQPFFWLEDLLARISQYRSPWFLLLHLWETHRPYRPRPEREKRWDKEGYERMVEETDAALEPILQACGEDTVVAFTGDHGERYSKSKLQQRLLRVSRRARSGLKLSSWAPGIDQRLTGLALGHGFALWEDLIRVPLVVSGPGLPQGTVDDQTRHVDLFPTLCEVCSLQPDSHPDGRSLIPLVKGNPLPEEPAYMEAVGVKLEGERIEGARTPDWKLVRQKGKASLYRLGARPDEKHDLSRRHPEVAHQLEAFIDKTLASGEGATPMSEDEEKVVEQHLRDLGYL